jgi:hypothetical protein
MTVLFSFLEGHYLKTILMGFIILVSSVHKKYLGFIDFKAMRWVREWIVLSKSGLVEGQVAVLQQALRSRKDHELSS